MQGWIDLFRSLGESLIEVLRAEIGATQEDLKTSGRHLGKALGLLAGAAAIGFWMLGLTIFFLVALLNIWLQTWAAAGIVLLLFAIVAGVLAKRGRAQLTRVENPVDVVKRHVDDHLDWWQNNLIKEPQPLDISPAAGTPAGAEAPWGGEPR